MGVPENPSLLLQAWALPAWPEPELSLMESPIRFAGHGLGLHGPAAAFDAVSEALSRAIVLLDNGLTWRGTVDTPRVVYIEFNDHWFQDGDQGPRIVERRSSARDGCIYVTVGVPTALLPDAKSRSKYLDAVRMIADIVDLVAEDLDLQPRLRPVGDHPAEETPETDGGGMRDWLLDRVADQRAFVVLRLRPDDEPDSDLAQREAETDLRLLVGPSNEPLIIEGDEWPWGYSWQVLPPKPTD